MQGRVKGKKPNSNNNPCTAAAAAMLFHLYVTPLVIGTLPSVIRPSNHSRTTQGKQAIVKGGLGRGAVRVPLGPAPAAAAAAARPLFQL